MSHLENSLEHHKARLRKAGYKLTNARITMLEVLQDLGGHITSADVLDAVAKVDETIGRASVFRTLDLLTQLGIIRPTYIGTSQTPTYVMLPNGHHHHVICTHCNRVIEFEDCGLGELEKKLETALGVSITGHLLEFYGLCQQCTGLSAT
ncbi:MAG: Fur family transcriptional regulator [Anaerolineae bacterium]|nr:Fur family transcriptional regulator [Anaerolineae bacterium]